MAIARAMKVLRAIASAGSSGAHPRDLVAGTGLHRVTVHRLLSELGKEGLVEQDSANRSYHLGPEAWHLGYAANLRFDLARIGQSVVKRIELETHDTIYLLRRIPGAVLCISRQDGSYPIKSLVMDVGGRYPLGIGGGGLAVLAFLPRPEIDAALADVKRRLAAGEFPKVTMAKVRALLKQTQESGYSYWPGLISEAHVIAVPILGPGGEPIGALSCGAIRERLDGARRKRVVALLAAGADEIRKQLPRQNAKENRT